jgi:glycolate oxidase iron-sulfur subunit
MQTSFTLAQLADPDVAEADRILRACVHCGFCTATCPTYVLLGDERDSPRGRIYLIKDMLENDRPATAEVVTHIDRCLSCLACMTTCPSGVHYMHLVDHARARIEDTYRRPVSERLFRAMLATVLPNIRLFGWALWAGFIARPFASALSAMGSRRLTAMLRLAPAGLPALAPNRWRQVFRPEGPRRGRVALLSGCIAPVLAPDIDAAAIRVLTRHGIEVVLTDRGGCCGSLVHHMGRHEAALAAARRRIDAWMAELGEGLDAILVTTSGCGTTVKDYGFMLRNDPSCRDKAARISSLAMDISEYLARQPWSPNAATSGLVVAYHAACSLQHGQKIMREPKEVLSKLGFVIEDVPEGHLCCGSAGTYNILQPDIAARLRDRKVGNIEKLQPDVVAAGNIGCITQIAAGTRIPVVHSIELIDWATGGPRPKAIKSEYAEVATARRAGAARMKELRRRRMAPIGQVD